MLNTPYVLPQVVDTGFHLNSHVKAQNRVLPQLSISLLSNCHRLYHVMGIKLRPKHQVGIVGGMVSIMLTMTPLKHATAHIDILDIKTPIVEKREGPQELGVPYPSSLGKDPIKLSFKCCLRRFTS